jgi:hypothetical protein
MPEPSPARDDITAILNRMAAGDPAAAEELAPLIYQELRN